MQTEEQNERLVVAVVPKGNTARVEVSLRTFRGRQFLDFRTHVLAESGLWVPTKKGFTFAPEQLPDLELAVRKLREVVFGGMVPPPETRRTPPPCPRLNY